MKDKLAITKNIAKNMPVGTNVYNIDGMWQLMAPVGNSGIGMMKLITPGAPPMVRHYADLTFPVSLEPADLQFPETDYS